MCVFHSFFNITARTHVFLPGIVHLDFDEFCIELFKTIVFYEVSFFRVGARTQNHTLCFYDGSCRSVCGTYVFYDVFLHYLLANIYIYE